MITTIMNHSDHATLIRLWKRINFDNGLTIPSLKMMDEAIFQPELDSYFAARILSNYQIFDASNLDKIINVSSSKTLWERFTKSIPQPHESPVMYAFFSLHNYRTPVVDDNLNSYSTLLCWSNSIIKNILPSLENDSLKDFCAITGATYSTVIYNKAVVTYCREMMPYPLRYIRNVDHDYLLREVVPGKFRETLEHPSNNIPFPSTTYSNTAQESYAQKIQDTDIKTSIRFSERAIARAYLQQLDLTFGKELLNYHSQKFQEFYELTKERKNNRRISKDNPVANRNESVLCQCQFCYSYRKGKLQNRIPWRCDRKECKSAYKAWVANLKRSSIKLETIYG